MTTLLKFIVSLGLPISIGYIQRLFTLPAIPSWYAGLQHPDFHPPFWVFGPVWAVLYPLMGLAMFLIWKQKPSSDRACALKAYFLQLVLNILWVPVFFHLEQMFFAFLLMIVLFTAIAETMRHAHRVSPWAAYLLVPYIIWVAFAGVLNGAIWWLNR